VLRIVVVLGFFGRRGGCALDVVAARLAFDIGRGGEIDDGARALLRCQREILCGAYRKRKNATAAVAETRGDEARMQAIGRYARARKTPCKLACEKDVAKLGTALDAEAAIAFGRLQVVEIEPGALVRIRGRRDDASALSHAGLQEI
jgi:hypothetical protein